MKSKPRLLKNWKKKRCETNFKKRQGVGEIGRWEIVALISWGWGVEGLFWQEALMKRSVLKSTYRSINLPNHVSEWGIEDVDIERQLTEYCLSEAKEAAGHALKLQLKKNCIANAQYIALAHSWNTNVKCPFYPARNQYNSHIRCDILKYHCAILVGLFKPRHCWHFYFF